MFLVKAVPRIPLCPYNSKDGPFVKPSPFQQHTSLIGKTKVLEHRCLDIFLSTLLFLVKAVPRTFLCPYNRKDGPFVTPPPLLQQHTSLIGKTNYKMLLKVFFGEYLCWKLCAVLSLTS